MLRNAFRLVLFTNHLQRTKHSRESKTRDPHDEGTNPLMFCRNRMGVFLCAHISMNWAPFTADSENRIPLFATIPIRCP